jgi:hypothetical protein
MAEMRRVMAYLPCPSGKVQYEKKIEALLCIVHWELKDDGHPRPRRAYECKLCGAWHLTKQPQKTEVKDGAEPSNRTRKTRKRP